MNPCEIRFQEHLSAEDVPLEAVVAGTMCLMSCAMQTGSLMYVKKIVDNLELLSSSPNLSCEMRSVCRKLACHWQCALDAGGADGATAPCPAGSAASTLH